MSLGTRSHPNGHGHSQVGCFAPLVGWLWTGALLHELCFEVRLTLLLHRLLQILLGACAMLLTKAGHPAGNAGKGLGSRQIQIQGLLQGGKCLLSNTRCAAEHKCHAKLKAISHPFQHAATSAHPECAMSSFSRVPKLFSDCPAQAVTCRCACPSGARPWGL